MWFKKVQRKYSKIVKLCENFVRPKYQPIIAAKKLCLNLL